MAAVGGVRKKWQKTGSIFGSSMVSSFAAIHEWRASELYELSELFRGAGQQCKRLPGKYRTSHVSIKSFYALVKQSLDVNQCFSLQFTENAN